MVDMSVLASGHPLFDTLSTIIKFVVSTLEDVNETKGKSNLKDQTMLKHHEHIDASDAPFAMNYHMIHLHKSTKRLHANMTHSEFYLENKRHRPSRT